MRRVLKDRHEVAHFFANKTQDEGKAGNMFFEDGILYSYGRHFAIAKWIGPARVAITTQRYSSSTARHISIAESALSHVSRVYCYDPSDTASQNKRHAMDLMQGFVDESTRPRIRQSTRDSCMACALNKAVEFNAYLAALTDEDRGTVTPIPTDNLAQFAEVRKQELDKARAVAEAKVAKQAEDAKAVLIEWRNGHDVDIYRLRNLPVALRLGYVERWPFGPSEQIIETSYGAQIPREDTLKVWTVVLACREQNRPLILKGGMPLGNYRLNHISAEGNITVGCHNIKYDELVLMAEKLGYNIPVEA